VCAVLEAFPALGSVVLPRIHQEPASGKPQKDVELIGMA
jgi:hypothetical protein